MIRQCSVLGAVAVLLACWAGTGAQAQTPFDSDFDHFTTGWPLEGSHRNVECSSCHVAGIFQGTSRQCIDCHSKGGLVRATPLPLKHIRTTAQCQDCHVETTWAPVWRVDHFQVQGSCSACHNGVIATGKNPTHIASGNNCEDCHSTFAWSPATFDHATVTGNCSSCHNGTIAEGKNPTHINTTNVCEDCHSSTTWDPVIRVDHAQVLGTCSTCHNGMIAQGKDFDHVVSGDTCDDCHTTTAWSPAVFDHNNVTPGTCNTCHLDDKPPMHIATQAQCDNCHLTTAWLPASFDHQNITSTCTSCHADDKQPTHFMTNQDCEACHTTNTWLPSTFSHLSAAYPGDHAGNLACTDCHTANSEVIPWPAPAYQPDCAGCHAGEFRSGPHKIYENPDTFYNVGQLRDCAGACHIYTNSTLTTIKELRPGPEHRVSEREF
jgi:hypothetical protein